MGEDRAAGCADLMERMGFQGKVLEENGDSFLFRQTWEGWPLFSQQVTLVTGLPSRAAAARSSRSRSRSTIWGVSSDTGRRTITVATALVDFFNGVGALGDVCNRIDAIEPGYAASTSPPHRTGPRLQLSGKCPIAVKLHRAPLIEVPVHLAPPGFGGHRTAQQGGGGPLLPLQLPPWPPGAWRELSCC